MVVCCKRRLHHEIKADDEPRMAVEEVVPPEVEGPVLEGVVHSGSRFQILIKTPGMDGTNHGSNGPVLFQRDRITQIFVVGIAVVCAVVDDPPGVCTPEETAVARNRPVQVEGRREVGELETVVEIERRSDLCANVKPLAGLHAIADEGAPIGTIRTRIEVDTRGEVVAQAILEGGVGLLVVDARPHFQRGIAIEFRVTHRTCIVGDLGEGP